MQALTAEHPFWGYHRIWADLRFVEQWPVHKKRGWRLMQEHHRVVPTNRELNSSGPVPLNSSGRWKFGSQLTTRMICTHPCGISPLGSLNALITSATGLRSWPLDKRGALQGFGLVLLSDQGLI
jgi:hypothetical protein